ncbi:MAG: Hpt domain-containing protein [Pseudomonadota bacterium]
MLYDRAHLAGFTEGDLDLEHALLSAFCANARDYLDILMRAPAGQEWTDQAHKLKGAANSVGVWSVARWCALAEDEPEKFINADQRQKLADHILDVIARLENAISGSAPLAPPQHMR